LDLVLSDNGGPTQTHALLAGSPAIDAGASCPTSDQRGAPRPQGGACDIGAYELLMAHLQTDAFSVREDAGLAVITATLDPDVTFPVSVSYSTSDGTAIDGVDYAAASGSLNFGANTTAVTFTVPILDNDRYNVPKWLNLTLSPGDGAGVQSPATATLTILDDEFGILVPLLTRDYNAYNEREPNDQSPQATGPLISGQGYLGTNKGANDADFFFFEAPRAGTITVNVSGLAYDAQHPERNGQVQLRYGSRTNPPYHGFAGAPPYQFTCRIPPPDPEAGSTTCPAGLYYVLVFTPKDYAGGQYTLTVTYP
jgi:hypothetical protein